MNKKQKIKIWFGATALFIFSVACIVDTFAVDTYGGNSDISLLLYVISILLVLVALVTGSLRWIRFRPYKENSKPKDEQKQ